MAEGEGLEPTIPRRETVFETVAIATMRPFLGRSLCTRQESNLDLRFRKPSFYPLNYGCIFLLSRRLFYHVYKEDTDSAIDFTFRGGCFLEPNGLLYQKQWVLASPAGEFGITEE